MSNIVISYPLSQDRCCNPIAAFMYVSTKRTFCTCCIAPDICNQNVLPRSLYIYFSFLPHTRCNGHRIMRAILRAANTFNSTRLGVEAVVLVPGRTVVRRLRNLRRTMGTQANTEEEGTAGLLSRNEISKGGQHMHSSSSSSSSNATTIWMVDTEGREFSNSSSVSTLAGFLSRALLLAYITRLIAATAVFINVMSPSLNTSGISLLTSTKASANLTITTNVTSGSQRPLPTLAGKVPHNNAGKDMGKSTWRQHNTLLLRVLVPIIVAWLQIAAAVVVLASVLQWLGGVTTNVLLLH